MSHIVPPIDIQSELTRLWESFKETNKLRACLFNLVIYTEKTPRLGYIEEVAKKVVEKFPARLTLIVYDPSKKESALEVSVSVMMISTGESDIACDFIQMNVSGDSLTRVPFIVIPNLIPDLPLYFVWASRLDSNHPLFKQLQPFATRVIFDSECAASLHSFAKELLIPQHYDIADLNWARIQSWREVLASTFHRADRLADLNHASTVKLIYNAIESPLFSHPQIQALYLQGWIASQLGWNFEHMKESWNELQLIYATDRGKIEVILQPAHHQKLNPGGIVSLELFTRDQIHYIFQRDLEFTFQIHVVISSPTECKLPQQYRFPKAESGGSLVYEICHKGTSEHFRQLLKMVEQYDSK